MDTDVYVKRVQKIKSYVNLIKKNFECSICIDFFEDPVITNCQHAFCKKCIENYIGSKRSQNCPLCKSAVNLRSLRSFTTLSNFVQKAKKLEEAFEKDLSNSKLPNSTISSAKADETPKDTQTSGENEPTTSDEANKPCISQKRKRVQSELINAPTCVDRNKKKKLNANSDTEPQVIEDTLIIQPNDQSETSDKHHTQPLADKTNQKSKSSIKITRIVGAENAAVEPKTIHFFESTSETAPSVDANVIKSVAELDNAENCPPPLNDAAAANERENNNENKNDYPLKFRKENSDISEQFTVLKSRTDNNINNQQINNATTPFNRNTALKRNKLSKSCGVNSNRVKIVEPIDRNKSLIEVHLNEPVAVVDPPPELNLLFDNNNSNHKPDNNQSEENQNQIQIQLGRVDDTILLESETINSRPCEKCARREDKKDAWTSTESAGRCEIAIQVDEADIISSRIDLDRVVDQLADDFYQHLENFMVNTIIEKYLESLIPLVIPDSPPHPPSPQQLQPPRSPPPPPPPNEPNEAPADRRSVQVKSTIPNESFSDLLETSVVNQSTRRKSQMAYWGRKKPPSLEFISSNRSNALNQSVNLDSSILRQTNALSKTVIDEESEKQQGHVEFDDGEETDKSHDQSKDSLIIDDTPVKTDNEQFRELDRRLSISATRMQAVNFIFPENYNNNYSNNSNSKSVYNNSETPKVASNNLQLPISMIITDTIQPNKQEDEEEEGSNVDEPTMILNTAEPTVILTRSPDEQEEKPKIKLLKAKPHPAPAETHSFLLNTLNSSNSNLTLLPDTNNYMNTSAVNGGRHSQGAGNRAPPPLASDILGVSYIHTNETTMNASVMMNRHESSIMQSDPAEKKPTPSRLSQSAKAAATATNQSNKRNDMETQLLTDSAMMKIDDICKDLYSAHNLTVNGDSYQMTSKSTGNSSASSAKFEFVFSLLKPEMKVVVKNYAKIIKATIANDVTETTTHLIVDSDENLRCGVTSKYLKAISRKIWIVSVAWILNSINLGQFLKPDKFEIKGDIVYGQHNGPANSRLTKRHLFGSYEFLFIGDYSNDTISLDNLIDLSMLNGASVKRKAKEFSENDPTKTKVILFDETKKRISTNTVSLIKQNGQIECVNKSWLLDSLACYEIRHFADYETYETVG